MALPTLSVVVANYNHARYLPTALRCVLQQDVQPLEIIVIDDGSTDDSRLVLEEIARGEPIIKLFPNSRNRGVTYSFNRGVSLARSEYVCAVAADDQILPCFFAETLSMAADYPQAGIIFGDVIKVDDDGNSLAYFGLTGRKEKTYFTPQSFLEDYLAVEAPGHSLCGATVYRRDRLLEMGGYADGLGSWVDTFVTRAIGLKYGACYIPLPFVKWRYAPNSLAHATTTWEALRIVRRAARQMRSARFRDCFPESYVRQWEESFRTYLLRQHLCQLPERRETMLQAARDRASRIPVTLERMNAMPILGSLLRRTPRISERVGIAWAKRMVRRAECRLQTEERYLYRQLDPALGKAIFPRRICEAVTLPSRRLPPLSVSDMESDGGYGFRASLDRLGVYVPSDQESVSLLRLYEDGELLARPHHTHADIRTLGAGRYSHWGNYLHFASSDNSDPRSNGREYVVEVPRSLLSCVRSLFRRDRAA
jgi:glycosyltransferase involved in cell wall biosynthesis